jgi:hypothetical protein
VPVTTPLEIIAAYDDTVLRAPLTVNGTSAALASLTLNVSTLTSGQGGVGFVNLTAPAPAGHVLVNLSSNNPAISLPADVTVSAGSTSGLFSFGALPVQVATAATIAATYGPSSASANVTVNPSTNVWVTSLSVNPTTVAAGTSSTATVVINAPAPSGGASVQLSSMSPASVPSTVIVPAGATSATFAVSTSSVGATTQAKLWAVLNTTWGAVLTVTPGSGGGAPTLSSLSLSPTSVTGGGTSQGTVALTAAAPSGGSVVTLASSNAAAATVPASVTVPAGSTSRTFTVTTQAVSSSTSSVITGTLGVSRGATLAVNAGSSTPVAPTLVNPGNGATVALPVTLDWSDVSGAASYQVQVDDSSSISSPYVVNQTVTTSQHTLTTLATRQYWWRVRGRNSAGTAGAWSAVRSFTLQGTTPPVTLSSIALSPTSVTGGTAAQGTATLSGAAPSGGAAVTLTSNAGAATVPASVTVAAGSTSATFSVGTAAVSSSTSVTISGAHGGTTRTASLTVNPAATGGTATLTVTASGRSGERITSSPAGVSVSVGSTGTASFATGTSITLTVSNGRDAIWSGACSSSGSKRRSCTFTLSANASVTANVQ